MVTEPWTQAEARVTHQSPLLLDIEWVSWTPLSVVGRCPRGLGLPVNQPAKLHRLLVKRPRCSYPPKASPASFPTCLPQRAAGRNPSHWKPIPWWTMSLPLSPHGSFSPCLALPWDHCSWQPSGKLMSHPPTPVQPRVLGGIRPPQPVNHAPLFHLLWVSNPPVSSPNPTTSVLLQTLSCPVLIIAKASSASLPSAWPSFLFSTQQDIPRAIFLEAWILWPPSL